MLKRFIQKLLRCKDIAQDGKDGWSYATPGSSGKGGNGTASSITGSSVTRAGGGGGGNAIVIGKGSIAIGGKGGDAN